MLGARAISHQFLKRTDVQLSAKIELASAFTKFLVDALAALLMHPTATLSPMRVVIPNAHAPLALFEGGTFLSARRTQLGWGLRFAKATSSRAVQVAAAAVSSSFDDDMCGR